jgi:hypothetical protein
MRRRGRRSIVGSNRASAFFKKSWSTTDTTTRIAQLLRTIIDGKARRYDLKPARTAALSTFDCVGADWKHFVREDGSSFENEDACVVYEEAGKYAPKDVAPRSRPGQGRFQNLDDGVGKELHGR